ncbi:MAG: XrtA/PEP-CTERM system histidine kinase PrsK, partial [Thiohalobacteraceae bacterium]
MPGIGLVGYTVGAIAFLVLALVLLTGQHGQSRKRLLLLASLLSTVWMGLAAYQTVSQSFAFQTQVVELLRDLAWVAFLVRILGAAYGDRAVSGRRFRALMMSTGAFVLLLISLTAHRFYSGVAIISSIGVDWLLGGYLLMAIFGLVLVEQLFRNTRPEMRRGIKYLCMGVGGMFAYDFYLYADALLFQRVDVSLWQARGFVNALVVPLIAVAIARDARWSLDIFVSRRIVFHTASLLGAGIYLFAMGAGGYYVRSFGGSWGGVAQVIFLFGAILVLAVLLFSGQLRASLRVLISKHFFHYKYDYRDEWLRFIGTLSSGEPDARLRERVVRAIAEIIESPAGVLWMRRDTGRFEPVASWQMDLPENASEEANGALVTFLERQEWVINRDEFERDPQLYAGLGMPDWLATVPRAWLITPLILHERLLGFILLARSPAPQHFNWEDCDLLKTAGRQAASHLAQLEAARALADARQFELCSRLSTYVMHDLKNLVAQLSLVVSNASKHKHNPQFMEDAIRTVEHSVDKMNRLMAHLRSGGADNRQMVALDLCNLLHEVANTMANGRPAPSVDCQAKGIAARANRDRFAAILGHLVRNAQDATAADGRIIMRLFKHEDWAVIEVQDNGSGMDAEFIRERLFRPFETTKGKSGMGIGVYETREFVRALGGDIEVISRVGEGTTFRMRVPISGENQNNVQLCLVEGDGYLHDGKLQEIAGR